MLFNGLAHSVIRQGYALENRGLLESAPGHANAQLTGLKQAQLRVSTHNSEYLLYLTKVLPSFRGTGA